MPQATAALCALLYAREWFARLDTEAATRSSEQLLENPASLEKARLLCAVSHAPRSDTKPGGEPARGLQVPAPSVFSEATKSLSIVVPAYNEEARLPATMDETLLCGPAAPAPQEPIRRARGAVHSAVCWQAP